MDIDIIESREFKWKLNNFTKSLMKGVKKLYSKDFSIFLENSETKWYFVIEIKNSLFELYLQKREANTDDFTVKSEVFVWTLNEGKKFYDHFLRTSNEYQVVSGYGYKNLFKIKDIITNSNQYLINNTLTIGLKVEIVKQKETLKGISKQYLTMCKEYFENKAYSDFKFICSDGTKIEVHRFILAGFSPVMKQMFDIKIENVSTMNIMDIDGETMTEILRFIYTQEIKDVENIAEKLLIGAEKYELQDLKKLCGIEMMKKLSVENAIDYFLLADRFKLRNLLVRSAAMMKMHHTTLIETAEKWNMLNRNNLMTLLDCYRQSNDGIDIFESTL